MADEIIKCIGNNVGETSRLKHLVHDNKKQYLDYLLERKIRPDVVMEIIYDVIGDLLLNVLELLKTESINLNHLIIAKLAKAGFLDCVLTTNFDCLIEIACEQQKVPVRVVSSSQEYAEDFGPKDGLTIYKLHGTIDKPETLIATINNVARGFDKDKLHVLTRLLSKYYILFLGYSGNDFAINSDYLFLEKAQERAKGFVWNLRAGETSIFVNEILNIYYEKGQQINYDLTDLLMSLCPRVGVDSNAKLNNKQNKEISLRSKLKKWSNNISERDACFSLGRLYLYSGLWDGALESMKIFYRKVRDDKTIETFHELGLACFYVAHAYERIDTFHSTSGGGKIDHIGEAYTYLQQAKITFRQLGNKLMLGRTLHTEARFMASRNFEKAFQIYKEAGYCYETAKEFKYLCVTGTQN